jgi:hypothetical protein
MLVSMLAYDPSTNPLNNNEWSFPVTEVIHIASMTMALGTIALIDLKLISPGLLTRKPSQLLRDTEIMTLIGLFIVIASGIVIWTTDPDMYLHNGGFLFKMTVLAAAIIFNYTVHRWAVKSDVSGLTGRLVGAVSLLLWIATPFGGIFTAFV